MSSSSSVVNRAASIISKSTKRHKNVLTTRQSPMDANPHHHHMPTMMTNHHLHHHSSIPVVVDVNNNNKNSKQTSDHHHYHHPMCGCAHGASLFLSQQQQQQAYSTFVGGEQKSSTSTSSNSNSAATPRGDYAFEIHANRIKFGPGVLREAGMEALHLGLQNKRIALFTDANVARFDYVNIVKKSLLEYGKVSHVEVYDQVQVEPTDVSFRDAAQFAAEGKFDGFVSVGGGSVMDTAKAANLYATYPPESFLDYVNAPIGKGLPCPGPLKPHIACPTTSGTGSEATGFSIFDLLDMKAKTGIADQYLRPDCALVDPEVTRTLPANVVAASGFDTLSHGLESYTALSYKLRKNYPFVFGVSTGRPQNQGSNPYADFGCLEALRIVSENIVRAVNDPNDFEARSNMMFASTLAGAAMGSAGVHLPHGLSYSISGLNRSFKMEGYPQEEPLIPHGVSVILSAPSVFRYTAKFLPERHLKAAEALGANTKNIKPEESGEVLRERLIQFMKDTHVPGGLKAVGFTQDDVAALVSKTMPQKRVVNNAPFDVTEEDLQKIVKGAFEYF